MASFFIGLLVLFELVGLGSWMPAVSLASHAAKRPTAVTLPAYQPAATPTGTFTAPNLTAAGMIAIDAASGQVLASKDAQTPRPIASITKIFTILVILRDHALDETVTIPTLPIYEDGAVLLGAPAGSKFKLGDLVKAALIPSDNDAADSLAIDDAGSVDKFTAKMNQLMADWDITGLHFASASGLTDTNNNASPEALAKAARLLLTNQTVKAITDTANTTISDTGGRLYPLHTSNELLQTPGFYGIKTGYTPLAGQCLVARAQVQARDVISVVLGSQDRFGETQTLINAISKGYTWQ